ncbi:MAG TPA: hypothetical protein VGR38_07860 [Candidatus Polarisedimenticolia bacterium]|nr:hypothetical protein [Candidatus Polarisedimenticolia bacterium]
MASEMEILELLEARVKRASETLRGLKQENAELREQLAGTEDRLRKTHETIASLEEQGRQGDELSRQLKLLQEERVEIRGRVTRMLETFAAMEETSSSGHADN